MNVTERATEFCEGAFGSFGVKLEPYIGVVTELLQLQADQTRMDIADVLRQAADLEAKKGPDGESDKIYWMREIANVLSVSRDDLIYAGLIEIADEVIAEHEDKQET